MGNQPPSNAWDEMDTDSNSSVPPMMIQQSPTPSSESSWTTSSATGQTFRCMKGNEMDRKRKSSFNDRDDTFATRNRVTNTKAAVETGRPSGRYNNASQATNYRSFDQPSPEDTTPRRNSLYGAATKKRNVNNDSWFVTESERKTPQPLQHRRRNSTTTGRPTPWTIDPSSSESEGSPTLPTTHKREPWPVEAFPPRRQTYGATGSTAKPWSDDTMSEDSDTPTNHQRPKGKEEMWRSTWM